MKKIDINLLLNNTEKKETNTVYKKIYDTFWYTLIIYIIQLYMNVWNKSIMIINKSITLDNERIIIILIFLLITKSFIEIYKIKETYKYIFINYFLFSLLLIVLSDFLMFFISIELFSMCTYILIHISDKDININNNNNLTTEIVQLKYKKEIINNSELEKIKLYYFIMSTISSLLILISISIYYSTYGSLTMNWNNINNISLIIFFISLLFKLGGAPLHIWLVPLYTKINENITLLFLFYTKSIIISIIYINLNLFKSTMIYYILIFSIIFSFFIGAIFPLFESNIKSILAYSSIYNVGFILLVILLKLFNIQCTLLLFLFIYIINILLIFSIYLLLKFNNKLSISDIRVLNVMNNSKNNQFLLFLFLLSIISIIGLPPFSGFYGKYLVWLSFTNIDLWTNSIFLYLFILSIIFTIISTFYYFNFLKFFIFFKDISIFYNKINFIEFGNPLIINKNIYYFISLLSIISLFFPIYFNYLFPILNF